MSDKPAPTHRIEYFGRLEVWQPIKPKPRKAP